MAPLVPPGSDAYDVLIQQLKLLKSSLQISFCITISQQEHAYYVSIKDSKKKVYLKRNMDLLDDWIAKINQHTM